MFPFVFWKIIFPNPRRLPWDHQFYFIISKQTILIFNAFLIRNFLMFVFIPNIIYCIIPVWNIRSINIFTILIPDMTTFYFRKYSNFSPNHTLNEIEQFLTFPDRFFTLSFLNNLFYRNLFSSFSPRNVSPSNNTNILYFHSF